MDAGVGEVGVVLDVLIELSRLRDGEDVAVAGVVVEGVGVNTVGRLLGSEEEDGTSVGVGAAGLGWRGAKLVMVSSLER